MITMITDHKARMIASLWQSSGSIGRHLAALASNAWTVDDLDTVEYEDEDMIETRRDALIDDVDRTLHDVTSEHDRKELLDLHFWLRNR